MKAAQVIVRLRSGAGGSAWRCRTLPTVWSQSLYPRLANAPPDPVITPVVLLLSYANDQLLNLGLDPRPAAAATGGTRSSSRRPRTILGRQNAIVTTAKPVVTVARNEVVDPIADYPRDKVEEPGPSPTWKLARNAQHGFGFNIRAPLRQECKGIGVIGIDADLFGQRTSFGHLDRNIAKICSRVAFADEAAAARAEDANAIEQDQAMGRLSTAGTFWIDRD
jgi:hypothetical protein